MKQKLAAFTLMELLIGMIISSIVISFGYSSYLLIYKQFLSYKDQKKELIEASLLNSVLNGNFSDAKIISYEENKLIITKENNTQLEYDMNDSFVLRKVNEITDTFKIAPMNITTTFVFPEQKAFVRNFSFGAKVLGDTTHFAFDKKYSAETLMNYEINFKK